MNDLRQLGTTLDQFGLRELAFEDAVLEMVAPVPHCLVNFAETLRVADVVGNDERMSHLGTRWLEKRVPSVEILFLWGLAA